MKHTILARGLVGTAHIVWDDVADHTFKWSGESVGASATYLYKLRSQLPATESVTVIDEASPPPFPARTDTGNARIELPSSDAASGGATDARGLTALTEDTTVTTVSVSSPAISVFGVDVGETHVVARTEDGEWWLPVAVR